MNRERLSIYEECKIIVALERKVSDLELNIETTNLDWFADILKTEVKELTQIINKLNESI
jgi:hypothetical protein